MATLSNPYLRFFCADPTDEDHDAGEVVYPPGCTVVNEQRQANLTRTACWNWALSAGRSQPTRREAPTNLYRDNNPVEFIASGDYGIENRRNALPRTALGTDCTPALNALWVAARNEADHGAGHFNRLAFMRAMAAVAARRNGLIVSAAATPYSLHVTVPDYQWFSWQHWALGVTYGGQIRYAQADPGADTINCGYRRVWEAERPRFITAFIYLTGFKQDHIDVLRVWIHRNMRCESCGGLKPLETGFNSRWHHCTSAACGRIYCGTCGGAMGGRQAFNRSRTCSHCHTRTELLGDS